MYPFPLKVAVERQANYCLEQLPREQPSLPSFHLPAELLLVVHQLQRLDTTCCLPSATVKHVEQYLCIHGNHNRQLHQLLLLTPLGECYQEEVAEYLRSE